MFEPVAQRYNGPELEARILEFWRKERVFERIIEEGADRPHFVFYEGPPTANGKPGIHHVLARTFKDLYPRFKTMRGYHCPRKAGWDTHGNGFRDTPNLCGERVNRHAMGIVHDRDFQAIRRLCRNAEVHGPVPYQDVARLVVRRIALREVVQRPNQGKAEKR